MRNEHNVRKGKVVEEVCDLEGKGCGQEDREVGGSFVRLFSFSGS